MRQDILSDVLSAISNGDRIGKVNTTTPTSKMVRSILMIMQKNNYIGNFEYIDDGKGGKFKINLLSRVNSCGSIRPRYSVKSGEYEKWERRFLPASGVGILIVSTSKGLMIHEEAKKKNIGGKLLAYVY